VKKLRHIAEYLGVLLCLFLAKRLPLNCSEAVATALGDLFFLLARKRKRIACDNVKRTGIATEKVEIERIVRASFRHMAILVVEALRAPEFFGSADLHEHVTFEIAPESQAFLDDPGQGIICASAHIGNWELGGFLLHRIKPILVVVRNMNNPYVDRLVREKTHRGEFDTTPKNGASGTRLIRVLKKGSMVGLLIDQYARRSPIMADFFGIPSATHTSPARLHISTKAPICIVFVMRRGPMKYTVSVLPPIKYEKTGDRDKDVRTIIETMNAELEKMIRRHPEQYLWAHRRWRDV
jgi:KDO2-lipid IV(A) lauroyltransferase